MPDVSFSDYVNGLSADTIGGSEKIPAVDVSTDKHVTPDLLSAYTIDQIHGATVITSLTDSHQLPVFTSGDDERIITFENVSAWMIDKLEAITTGTVIASGDTVLYSDGGVLKQIDIDAIVAFVNSENGTLGAQVDALSAATLADTDEYLVEQGGTALKTTFSGIAARVHSQFLAYLGTLSSAASVVDADTIYVNDGGTAKNVAMSVLADYMLAENKTEILESAWDDYAALGGAAAASDVFLLERSGTGKTVTGANLASYVTGTLDSAGAASPTTAAGDDFIMFRGGIQYETDIDELATYIHDAIWTETSGDPVVDADVIAIGRSGDTNTVTALQIQTYVLDGIQADVLDLTGLTTATIDDADLVLIGDGSTGKKATASALATYVQGEIEASVAGYGWDNYTAIGGVALATDVFLLERSSTGRTITGANLASYIIGTQDSASAADPVAAGDDFLMYRSGTQFKADVDVLGTYILASAWSASSGNPVASGDKVSIGRSGTTYSVTVDQLQTFVLDGNQQDVLDFSGLSATTLGSSHLFAVYTGSTAEKVTLANLETQLWADFDAYVTALTAVTTLGDADVFYTIQGGTPKKITADGLASYMDDELWADASALTPAAAGDDIFVRRSGTSYAMDIDVLATYINTNVQSTVLDFSGLTADTPGSTDTFVFDDGDPKKITLANLETKLWTDFATYVDGLAENTTVTATDKIWSLQAGTPKWVDPDSLATYFDVGTGDVLGPVTTTENNIPQWDSTTKTLKDGLTVVTSIVPDAMSDTQIPTAQAVDEYFSEAELDIDGLTDIGEALVDADLIVIDNGASGLNRKSAISRLWTYIASKIQALSAKAAPVAADILMIQDSAASNALKELTVGNLWANRYTSTGLATSAGTGITAAVASHVSGVERVGSFFKTTIVMDIAGLRSGGTAGYIIGDNGTSNPCHIGQITAAKNGTIFAGKIECLETPAGGDPDIDLYSATESTGAEGAAISTLTETQLIDSGDHAVNAFKSLTAFPAADEYLYLVAGDTDDADYTAGIIVIELWGK